MMKHELILELNELILEPERGPRVNMYPKVFPRGTERDGGRGPRSIGEIKGGQ